MNLTCFPKFFCEFCKLQKHSYELYMHQGFFLRKSNAAGKMWLNFTWFTEVCISFTCLWLCKVFASFNEILYETYKLHRSFIWVFHVLGKFCITFTCFRNFLVGVLHISGDFFNHFCMLQKSFDWTLKASDCFCMSFKNSKKFFYEVYLLQRTFQRCFTCFDFFVWNYILQDILVKIFTSFVFFCVSLKCFRNVF